MSTSAQHFLRNSTRIVGNRDACQHAGHLLHALPCRQNAQTASSGLARKLFLHAPVIVTARSHLRQMRHTEDLTAFAESVQKLSHHLGGCAANAAIDLVENERGDRHGGRRDHGNGKADAGKLAAGSDLGQGPSLNACVAGNEKLAMLRPRCTRWLIHKRDHQTGPLHRQTLHLSRHGLAQRQRAVSARFRQPCRRNVIRTARRCLRLSQSLDVLGARQP